MKRRGHEDNEDCSNDANTRADKTVKRRGQGDKLKQTGESNKENKPMKNDVSKKDKLERYE